MNLIHISSTFIVMWKPVPVDSLEVRLILFIICIIKSMKAVYNPLPSMQYGTSPHSSITALYSILLRIFEGKYSADLKDFQTEFVTYLKYYA